MGILINIFLSDTMKTIALSALSGIVFSFIVNFVLQKMNRKGNILSEKGFLIMTKLKEFEKQRIRILSQLGTADLLEKKKIRDIHNQYWEIYSEFSNFIEVYSFLLNKKCKFELEEYMNYAKSPLDALTNLLNDESASMNFNNKQQEKLSEQIINLIQKQMI
ncbi:hypothetical protein ABH966_003536 [Lysinibacillus sp. RC46]|uniref:hypothetical protein n=1 Tax=Lysinibacillus sp. RC46 TaxID=3156295 RepID=UPI003511FDD2